MSETATQERTAAEPIVEMKPDRVAGQDVALRQPRSAPINHMGEFSPENLRDALEFAKMMALSGAMVPQHCRNEPGVCLGIFMRASVWKADPFAVADKSYLVRKKIPDPADRAKKIYDPEDPGRIAYEASLIHAVIQKFGNLLGDLETTYMGDVAEGDRQGEFTDNRRIKVVGTYVQNGVACEREYLSPPVSKIRVKNSPLWEADLEQQLHYYGSRAWARRWRPGVILGVYTVEEMQEAAEQITDADRAVAIEARGDVLDDDALIDPNAPPDAAPLSHRFSYALEQVPTDLKNAGALQAIYLRFQTEVETTGPETRTEIRAIYELHLRRMKGDVPHDAAMDMSRGYREPADA